ncbi:MAG: ferredoxin [Thermoproteota archaeon]|jgi:ferredoxin
MIINIKYFKGLGYLKSFLKSFYEAFFFRTNKIKKNKYKYITSGNYQVVKRGLPKLIKDKANSCDSCGDCIQVCPTNALNLKGEVGNKPKSLMLNVSKCISCVDCQDICHLDVLVLDHEKPTSQFYEKNNYIELN